MPNVELKKSRVDFKSKVDGLNFERPHNINGLIFYCTLLMKYLWECLKNLQFLFRYSF